MINPLFDGLAYDMRGYFVHYLSSICPYGAQENTMQPTIYLHVSIC